MVTNKQDVFKPAPKQKISSFRMATRKFFCQFSVRGRSSRSEYWFGYLNLMMAGCVIFFIMSVMDSTWKLAPIINIAIWGGLLWLALCGFFNFCRRLHDIGFSAWAMLLFGILNGTIRLRENMVGEYDTICAIAAIVSFVCWLLVGILPSEKRQNEYGEIPNLASNDSGV